MAALASASPMCQVLWIHARGNDTRKILRDASFPPPPDDSTGAKVERVFTQRPATRKALMEHVSKNQMLRSQCDFSAWLGQPIDVFYYPPPSSDSSPSSSDVAPISRNYVAATLLLSFDSARGEFFASSTIEPHGLCLCVAAGVVPAAEGEEGEADLKDVTKEQVIKLLEFMGQVGELGGKKIQVAKEGFDAFDHMKCDKVDPGSGEIIRGGFPMSLLLSDKGVVFPEEALTTTESGLKYLVLRKGTGTKTPAPKTVVFCHYCGWLGGFENPQGKFDSSRDKEKEFKFMLGVGEVIKAWDEAIAGMVKGERRLIVVPEYLGYGSRGAGEDEWGRKIIPPGATLYFDVELLRF